MVGRRRDKGVMGTLGEVNVKMNGGNGGGGVGGGGGQILW